jgi:cytochrome c
MLMRRYMVMRRYRVLPACAVTLVFALGAQHRAAAAPDLARGELLFQTCTACHSVLGDGVGPNLKGVYGRKAATTPGFNYSAALKSSNLVWNDANLRAFVKDPQALVKGTAMTFPGYPSQSDVDDVIAYLKTFR